MKLLHAIIAATAAEASLMSAALGLASVAGSWNGWLDVLAQLSPVWFIVSLAGGLVALAAIEAGPSKIVVLLLAVVGLASNGWLITPELARALAAETSRPHDGAPALRVLTFNAWSDNLDPKGSVDAVLRANADVVALQEVSALGLPERLRLRAAYPYWAVCHPDCDLILLGKTPWNSIGWRQSRVPGGYFSIISAAATARDGRAFTLATTHYAWPFPPAPQAAQRAALVQAVAGLDRPDLVLTGDFNLTPWSAALRSQDAALAPLRRRTLAVFSWPANLALIKRPAPFPLLPIDQVYAGPDWRTHGVTRLPRLGSDHYPVLVELDRGPEAMRPGR